jgi:hypothetical protein
VVSPKITASYGGPDRALDVMIAALVIALIVSVWRR